MAAASRAVVPRPAELLAKVARLRAAGARELQVIMDFDHTLTRFVLPDGRAAPMCHDVVERSPLMPTAFHDGYAKLWADQDVALKEKNWNWEEWWRRSHQLMLDHGLCRAWLPEMIRASGLACRSGCKELFKLLEAHDVPSLVVSAGLTPVIREVLAAEGVPTHDLRVLANDMQFDEDSGVLSSFSEPPLHSHAKDSVGFRLADYFAGIARRHVVILGDSVSDCDCLVNIPGIDETIRVGFFNRARGVDRSKYEDVYDLVLTNEGLQAAEDLNLSLVLELLAGLVSPQHGPTEELCGFLRVPPEAAAAAAVAATAE